MDNKFKTSKNVDKKNTPYKKTLDSKNITDFTSCFFHCSSHWLHHSLY